MRAVLAPAKYLEPPPPHRSAIAVLAPDVPGTPDDDSRTPSENWTSPFFRGESGQTQRMLIAQPNLPSHTKSTRRPRANLSFLSSPSTHFVAYAPVTL